MSSGVFDIKQSGRYVESMTARSVFPLRFSTPGLRELVRMLAERSRDSLGVLAAFETAGT